MWGSKSPDIGTRVSKVETTERGSRPLPRVWWSAKPRPLPEMSGPSRVPSRPAETKSPFLRQAPLSDGPHGLIIILYGNFIITRLAKVTCSSPNIRSELC